MRDQPPDVPTDAVIAALRKHWDFTVAGLRYAPAGVGGYHWVAADGSGERRFVTVTDLAATPSQLPGWDASFADLQTAMRTAASLATEARLDFVVAPLPAASGEIVRRLQSRHAVAVFPFVDAPAGHYGEVLPTAERAAVVDMLARLHRVRPARCPAVVRGPALAGRPVLEAAMTGPARCWAGGPYATRARALTVGHSRPLRGVLARFDELAGQLAAAGAELVVTHGEPHPGNVLRAGARRLLIDWDTAGLAWPERDLWMVARDGEDIARYEAATGAAVSDAAMLMYRIRWDLDDISLFLRQFRSAARPTAGAEQAWTDFTGTLAQLPGLLARMPGPARGG